MNEAIFWSSRWLEEEKQADSINIHSFDGNSAAKEYYIHLIPRIKGDMEWNDEIYGMIDKYDLSILDKFK